MAKHRSRRDNNLRRHIAYLAARLMAEDGIADYATAKQKAARQAGLADANLLPDNSEIEAALREYQGLYQKEMRDFEVFRPALVGSVLSGTASQFSDVNLQLFTDDVKALTMFLLNNRYRFEEGSRRMRRGDAASDVPQIHLQVEDVDVTLTVLQRDDERLTKSRGEGDAPLRARLADVEALLRSASPSG
jgi:hypothetical protein